MGKTKHLGHGHDDVVAEIEAEIERRWERLKARNDHPFL
jgi:hypothetical protein